MCPQASLLLHLAPSYSSPDHHPFSLQDLAFRRNPFQMILGRGTVVVFTDADPKKVHISKMGARKLYIELRSVSGFGDLAPFFLPWWLPRITPPFTCNTPATSAMLSPKEWTKREAGISG